MANKTYLVDLVLPIKGSSLTADSYKEALKGMGYNKFQRIGSLGGASNGKSISIKNKIVSRIK